MDPLEVFECWACDRPFSSLKGLKKVVKVGLDRVSQNGWPIHSYEYHYYCQSCYGVLKEVMESNDSIHGIRTEPEGLPHA
jgi:hypothetical protein